MKKWGVIVIIAIVALAVVAGGFWYGQKNKPEPVNAPVAENVVGDNSLAEEQEDDELQGKVVSGGEEIDISDWLTYRNEEYGFEVRYPGEWVLTYKYKEFNENNLVAFEKFFVNKYEMNDGGVFKINIYPNIMSKDINTWLNENYPIDPETSTLQEQKNTNISTENAMYRTITSNVSGGYFNDLTFINNNTVYYIEIIERILTEDIDNIKKYNNVINNILSSFAFTD